MPGKRIRNCEGACRRVDSAFDLGWTAGLGIEPECIHIGCGAVCRVPERDGRGVTCRIVTYTGQDLQIVGGVFGEERSTLTIRGVGHIRNAD